MIKENNNQSFFIFLAVLLLVLIACLLIFTVKYITQNKKSNSPQEQNDIFKDVRVVSVYDGDTFKINLNCDTNIFCNNVPVRVKGIDCPEMKSKTEKEKELAQQAKQFTKDFFESQPVNLSNCTRDKYFRINCSVEVNGQDLATLLLDKGLAYKYDGGTKQESLWEDTPDLTLQ